MRAFVLLALLLVAACATGPSPEHVAFLNALIGKSETELVRVMGVPKRTIETGGHRFLAYERQRPVVIPGSGPYLGWSWGSPGWGWGGGYGYPPEIVMQGCETTFEIDAGQVRTWNLRGDDCR